MRGTHWRIRCIPEDSSMAVTVGSNTLQRVFDPQEDENRWRGVPKRSLLAACTEDVKSGAYGTSSRVAREIKLCSHPLNLLIGGKDPMNLGLYASW